MAYADCAKIQVGEKLCSAEREESEIKGNGLDNLSAMEITDEEII